MVEIIILQIFFLEKQALTCGEVVICDYLFDRLQNILVLSNKQSYEKILGIFLLGTEIVVDALGIDDYAIIVQSIY